MPVRLDLEELVALRILSKEKGSEINRLMAELSKTTKELKEADENYAGSVKEYEKLNADYFKKVKELDDYENQTIWETYDVEEVLENIENERPEIMLITAPTLTLVMELEELVNEFYKKHNI